MKITEFRKLIREEVRRVISEADFKVGSVVKINDYKNKILGVYPNAKIALANYKNDVPNNKYNSKIEQWFKDGAWFKPNDKLYLIQQIATGYIELMTAEEVDSYVSDSKKSKKSIKPNPKDFVLIQDEDDEIKMSKSARDLKDSYKLIASEGEEVTKYKSWNDAKKEILENAPDLKKYFKTVDALPVGTYEVYNVSLEYDTSILIHFLQQK